MPLYDVKCRICGEIDTIFRKVDERDLPAWCNCGGETDRVLSAPMLAPSFPTITSPNTGKLIDSRTKWQEDLRRSGAIPWEPGLDRDIARNRERAKEDAFKPIEKAIDNYVTAAVSAGHLET